MQITQFFLPKLRKDTISALDDRVVIHSKSISAEFEFDYRYVDLSTSTVKGKTGDGGWDIIALLVFCLTIIVDVLARFLFHFKGYAIETAGFILAIFLFCLRFIKYDFVTIMTSRDDRGFLIKLSGKERIQRENFVQFLLAKIKDARPNNI